MLPAEIFQFSRGRGRSVEDTLRIGSLSKRCQVEREKLGLTVKQAAALRTNAEPKRTNWLGETMRRERKEK